MKIGRRKIQSLFFKSKWNTFGYLLNVQYFSQKFDGAKLAQETALNLLKGATEKSNDIKYKIAENYCIMHTGEKNNLEKALDNFFNLENLYVNNKLILLMIKFWIKNL